MRSSKRQHLSCLIWVTKLLEVTNTTQAIVGVQNDVSAKRIREIIIDQSYRAHVGHIGSALSVADIVACLYGTVLNVPHPSDRERDRFVLSKGHAALAVYAALYLRGWISEEELNSFCGDDSNLGVHPEFSCPGIDFATGSLGQGLSFAAGAALAAKLQRSTRRAFAVISDAECNEGSLWETIMFAAHHQLNNLVAIMDLNGQQAFGYTKDVIDLSPIDQRWRAFNWDVHIVDGHDIQQMAAVIANLNYQSGQPHVLIARTIFGKGVPYMEHQIKWHYNPLSDSDYKQAKEELRHHI